MKRYIIGIATLAVILCFGLLWAESGPAAAPVTLSWDPDPSNETVGYKVYYGSYNFAKVPVGKQTNVSVINLLPSKLYSFAVSSYDSAGAESELSAPVLHKTPPGQPATIKLDWSEVEEENGTPGIAGYMLHYGYAASPLNVTGQTSVTISNLTPGQIYFFAVAAYNQAGQESEPSSLMTHKIPFPGASSADLAASTKTKDGDQGPSGETAPNQPEMPGTPAMPTPLMPSIRPGTARQAAASSPSTAPTQQKSTSPAPEKAEETAFSPPEKIPGVPPRLALTFSNREPGLTIWGTLGSSAEIQRTTDPSSPDKWTTVSALNFENPGPPPAEQAKQSIPALIQKAFPSSKEAWQAPAADGQMVFYRVILEHDYPTLADKILKPQGYQTKLIAVRLAATGYYVVCYVPEEKVFIDYDEEKNDFNLQPSAGTIREIATSASSLLSENWTSASEFVMANNIKKVVATVVKTDPASLDGTAGASTSNINIDF